MRVNLNLWAEGRDVDIRGLLVSCCSLSISTNQLSAGSGCMEENSPSSQTSWRTHYQVRLVRKQNDQVETS